MNPAKYNKRIEIWGKVEKENEVNETTYEPEKIKTIWAEIIPQTGKLQNGVSNKKFANVDVKIKCRYSAGKNIKKENWIMFKDERFDIEYILNPGYQNIELEIFATSLRE